MALHGDLNVNDQAIGGWSVQRLADHYGLVDEYHSYRWVAALDGHAYEGIIRHRHAEGAPKLVALVMQQLALASTLTSRPPPAPSPLPAGGGA